MIIYRLPGKKRLEEEEEEEKIHTSFQWHVVSSSRVWSRPQMLVDILSTFISVSKKKKNFLLEVLRV